MIKLMIQKKHTVIPFFLLIMAVLLQYSGMDLWLETFFYDPASKSWPLKTSFLTSSILHTGGKRFVVGIAFLTASSLFLSLFTKKLGNMRKPLIYLLLSGLLGPLLISTLKHLNHIHSPWDLAVFGGHQPYIRLFDAVPTNLKSGNAFPSGHAAGGFAFFCLYFLLLQYRASYRHLGILCGILLGMIFGVTQQMRGAHFISHDIFAMVICWYSALFVYYLMYQQTFLESFHELMETLEWQYVVIKYKKSILSIYNYFNSKISHVSESNGTKVI